MPRKTTYLPLRQRRFIAKLAEGASVASAARQVGMSRAEVYVWRKENPKLAEGDQVVATSIDLLEDEARKRAMEVSDGMLKLLLKCLRPEVWNPSVRRKSNRRKSNK